MASIGDWITSSWAETPAVFGFWILWTSLAMIFRFVLPVLKHGRDDNRSAVAAAVWSSFLVCAYFAAFDRPFLVQVRDVTASLCRAAASGSVKIESVLARLPVIGSGTAPDLSWDRIATIAVLGILALSLLRPGSRSHPR